MVIIADPLERLNKEQVWIIVPEKIIETILKHNKKKKNDEIEPDYSLKALIMKLNLTILDT